MSTLDLNTILNAIKSKLFLSEVIGKDIKLTKKGREFVGNCPFHNEKTGSFFVNDDKGKYYCFGCGAHGDVFSYVIDSKGYNFKQALEYLASEAGVKLPVNDISYKKDKTLLDIMNICADFFHDKLLTNTAVLKYCKKRDLNNDIINIFRIGYCPRDIKALYEKLVSAGFKFVDIRKSNVFIDKNSSKFSERLIFPVFDKSGNVIAFGARTLLMDGIPKYINSPESEIFHKKETLYGYNIANKNVSSKGMPYIVVEGYTDVVIMHKFGFNTAVASMGTAFTSDHLLNLWKYCDEPIICLDGDTAGKKAMLRAANVALEYIAPGKTVKFCELPSGSDPDTYLREYSASDMKELLIKSIYLIDFIWNDSLEEYTHMENKTPEHIMRWKKSVLERINVIKNEELRRMYFFNIKDRINDLLISGRKANLKSSLFINKIDKKNNVLLRESLLLYTALKYETIIPDISEKLSSITFSNDQFNDLRDFLVCEEKITCKYDNLIAGLKKVAEPYCEFFNGDSLVEIVDFWNDIFDNHVFRGEYNRDLEKAKQELEGALTRSSWERLKALKIGSFKVK